MPLKKMMIGEREFDFTRPYIVGVVNVAPDSFSGDGVLDIKKAVAQGKQMVLQGADIIDVGGESSRPGAKPVSVQDELKRVLPVVEGLVKEKILVSIDTSKPKVAEACLKAGAHMINDITSGRDKKMFLLATKYNVPIILMHMKGTPRNMQENPSYTDVVGEVALFFKERIVAAKRYGVKKIILDPGIGFGKRVIDNLVLLKNLNVFTKLGCPLFIGASRKSFIGKLTGAEVQDRLPGTLAAHLLAVLNGANLLRCHDVKEHVQALTILDSVLRS